jgi:hypothetical protein
MDQYFDHEIGFPACQKGSSTAEACAKRECWLACVESWLAEFKTGAADFGNPTLA